MTAMPTRRRFLRIAAIHAASLAVPGLWAARGDRRRPMRPAGWRGIALGAEASIRIYGEDMPEAHAVLRECQAEILRLEAIFSLYDARSALARLNRQGNLADAPPELVELIAEAHRFSVLTDGAFDISIHPLCELLARDGAAADEPAIGRALELVDYRRIECRERAIRFAAAGMRITLNGIAQGYITDRIADLLRRRGFSRVLVDIGEKRALDGHPDGRPWRIGIESPFDRGRIVDVIEIDNRALATSGGYGERYDARGVRHHLLDGRTGLSRHFFASVSALAPTATTADALSTCLAVIQPDKAAAVLSQFPHAEAVLVRSDGGRIERIPAPSLSATHAQVL